MRNTEALPIPPPLVPGLPSWEIIRARALALLERKRRQDELLDMALEETFPASDPPSVMRIN
jgi:hypothetical protein